MTNNKKRLNTLKQQIKRLDSRLEILHRRSARYSQIRLGVFFGGVVLLAAALYFGGPWIGGLTLAATAATFIFSVRVHQQIEQSLIKHQIWRALKSNHIAAMTLDWANIPPPVFGRAPAEHPFARDLDLTGERAIHRLIDSAVSQEGSALLKDWLLNTRPNLEEIQQRQAQVKALIPLARFRNRLTMYGMLASSGYGAGWQGKRLLNWLEARDKPGAMRPYLIAASILAGLNIILFALNYLALIPNYWIASFILYLGVSAFKWRETGGVFDGALILQDGLKKLKAVFHHLETSHLEFHPALHSLCEVFLNNQRRPSNSLKPVTRTVAAAGLTANPIIGLAINLVIPWNLFFAHRLNAQRDRIARQLPAWLAVWFELEALCSLATFAWLNPEYSFPRITMPVDGQPLLQASNIGHPLIPAGEKVCNDFTAHNLGDVLIITGSNMAGKSSFLRTLGVNLCLAYAGGPVNAARCDAALFRLFTALSARDSVTDGISYFYAEVKRLRRLLSTLEQPDPLPLFHLIDEIFRGTNNRERFIGSRSFIRALVGQNGFGLIATHDLELVKLAGEIPQISNCHFREEVVDGRMAFDYRLQPGPCPTTNALKIMEIEGLPVDKV